VTRADIGDAENAGQETWDHHTGGEWKTRDQLLRKAKATTGISARLYVNMTEYKDSIQKGSGFVYACSNMLCRRVKTKCSVN